MRAGGESHVDAACTATATQCCNENAHTSMHCSEIYTSMHSHSHTAGTATPTQQARPLPWPLPHSTHGHSHTVRTATPTQYPW